MPDVVAASGIGVPRTCLSRAATDVYWNKSVMGTSRPRRARSRLLTARRSSDVSPRSKKLTSTSTVGRPSTSATTECTGPRDARDSKVFGSPAGGSTVAKRTRSTLPLRFRGMSSICVSVEGTM